VLPTWRRPMFETLIVLALALGTHCLLAEYLVDA
jgi:hypothetical protein